MKALVAYESQFGNTEKVAQAIGSELGAQVVRAGDVGAEHLQGVELFIVGSATQKFTAMRSTKTLLKDLAPGALRGVKVAAFDTRFRLQDIEQVKVLAFLVRMFGYAAEPLAKRLQKAGGELVVPPEPFYVGETKGPLLDGELERATAWARKIKDSLAQS